MADDKYSVDQVRDLLTAAFDSGGIDTLAFNLFQPVYQDFSRGMTRSQKIEAIVLYAHQHGHVPALLNYVKEKNSYQYGRYFSEPSLDNLQSPVSNLRFYANAPYGLEVGFTGRTPELAMLDKWLTNDPDHPLLALIALGGTGKSALAWYWQQCLAEAVREPPLQAIIWWDFYQPGAGVGEFLTDALTFFGDEPQQYGNPRLQLNHLFEHLRRTPALLVLDGAERLLRAYSGMDAAYLGDAEAEAGQPRGRDCVEPVAGSLLTGLAQMQGQTKTLLTSRLLPRELEGRSGGFLQGVRRHNLTGLDPEDAYQLFRKRGIKTARAEVRAVAEPLDYHPLSLALLATRPTTLKRPMICVRPPATTQGTNCWASSSTSCNGPMTACRQGRGTC